VIDKSWPAATSYAHLISGLRHNVDVGIYNLNYDPAALTWPDAHTGFDVDGRFSQKKSTTVGCGDLSSARKCASVRCWLVTVLDTI
jgi:hypothetical protein